MVHINLDCNSVVSKVASIDLQSTASMEEDSVTSIAVGLVILKDRRRGWSIAGLGIRMQALEAIAVANIVSKFLERQFVGIHFRVEIV
jgi:hypothetical protein